MFLRGWAHARAQHSLASAVTVPAGETVLYAAARYCCTTGTMLPVEQLTKAGADWTKPNRLGVSPLLLLLRHVSAGHPLPTAVQQDLLHGSWKEKWTRQVRQAGMAQSSAMASRWLVVRGAPRDACMQSDFVVWCLLRALAVCCSWPTVHELFVGACPLFLLLLFVADDSGGDSHQPARVGRTADAKVHGPAALEQDAAAAV